VTGKSRTTPDAGGSPADLESFLQAVKRRVGGQFRAGNPIVIARAPGRLDVMGGIADYSGSLVLEMPLAVATRVALQQSESADISIVSPSPDDSRSSELSISLTELLALASSSSLETARAHFARRPRDRWTAYIAGAFIVLAREHGARFSQGATLYVESGVPEGRGIGSSAALEVAAMSAVAAAYSIPLEPRALALLCQKVENEVAGAPCGVMDPMTSACGEKNRLLALRCRPCELVGMIALPTEVEIVGLDSSVKHSVAGDAYGRVRCAAFMGYRMLAQQRGLKVHIENGRAIVDDPEWRGYLAACDPDAYRARFESHLPESMPGEEFLARYGASTDTVTSVDREQSYPVRAATRHPIEENRRVERFRELLLEPLGRTDLFALGDLMFESHESYSRCGLGCEETDWIVERVHQSRASGEGLLGAKITGGGSGGTVAILGFRDRCVSAAQRIAADYFKSSGRFPQLFIGSSPGAATCPPQSILF